MGSYPPYIWSLTQSLTYQVVPAILGTVDTIKGISIVNNSAGTLYYTLNGAGNPLTYPQAKQVPPGGTVNDSIDVNNVVYFAYKGATPTASQNVIITFTDDDTAYSASTALVPGNLGEPVSSLNFVAAANQLYSMPGAGVNNIITVPQWSSITFLIHSFDNVLIRVT